MTPPTVVVAGGMGSGKSTVAAILADRFVVPLLSFGDLVRREAAARGLRKDRQTLQDLGQSMYELLGPEGLVNRLLNAHTGPCVIDGVRHRLVLDAIRARSHDVVAVYLLASEDVAQERWMARNQKADLGVLLDAAKQHPVEDEVAELRSAADLVVRTDAGSREEIVDVVISHIDSRGDS